jgi:hypothetical protein
MQIAEKYIDTLLMIMVVRKIKLKEPKCQKTTFHAFVLGNGRNEF